jgi:hypothetical protein
MFLLLSEFGQNMQFLGTENWPKNLRGRFALPINIFLSPPPPIYIREGEKPNSNNNETIYNNSNY